jgi:hypothetical protein
VLEPDDVTLEDDALDCETEPIQLVFCDIGQLRPISGQSAGAAVARAAAMRACGELPP